MGRTDGNFGRRWVLSRLAVFGTLGPLGGVSSRVAAAQPETVGELGTVSAPQHHPKRWHSLRFDGSYTNPVVIMGPLSQHGRQPAHVRLRNVSSDRVEWKIEEWDYLGGWHLDESVSYLVLEGDDLDVSGTPVRVGTVETDDHWRSVTFSSPFERTPVVLARSQTFEGNDPITAPIRDVTRAGFSVRVQEEEARERGGHMDETVGYVAIGQGAKNDFESGTVTANDAWASPSVSGSYDSPAFVASMQTVHGSNTADLRHRRLRDFAVDVRIEEERSHDHETNHRNETVGYVFGESGRIQGTVPGSDTSNNPMFGACFPTTTNGDDESQYYENWLGREVMVSDIFIEKRDQMHNIPSWKIDPWTNWLDENQHRRLCWDVLVRSYSNLRDAANGSLVDEFQSFGQTLVEEGHENAYIRIEDEFDLDHAFHPETSQEKQWFVEFWREAVDTLRAVDGQEFTIIWNPNYDVNEKGGYAEDMWPGDEYVDQVGIDIYDLSWKYYDGGSKPTRTDHKKAWKQSKSYLDWFSNWCDTHDKPLCIPEWGLWSRNDWNRGGGDNPYFIKRMYDWIHQNDVAWHVYFETLHKHEMYGPDTQFPKASATFKQLFG